MYKNANYDDININLIFQVQGIIKFQGCIEECSYRFNILRNVITQHLICNVYIVVIRVEDLLSECSESVDAGNILH